MIRSSSGLFWRPKAAARGLAVVVIALLSLAGSFARAAAGSEIVLTGQKWSITIEPATLRVSGTPMGETPLTLSAGRPQPGGIADLRHDGRQASWRLPDERMTVAMRLEDDALVVRFTAEQAGSFTWPIDDPGPACRAFILPMFEGLYVPADDPEWAAFLKKQGPLNTTADFSMPFWGVDAGAHTITYIATNPFNNQISFGPGTGKLAARFAHEFTPNHRVKEYGFRICLGEAPPIAPALAFRSYLVGRGEFVSMKQKIERTPDAAKLLGAAHIYLWGEGLSPKMLQRFADAGLDRLWLGSSNWTGLAHWPQTVRKAISLGYLIGPYDSFNTVHSPDEPDTWETAQFGRKLYEDGPIVNRDGSRKKGFQHKGYALSPIAARPYVEARVSKLMAEFRCNSWFIDCDAFGDLFDDYSPLHPATQEDDMNARLSRMAWVRDTYKAVIGSEGGSAYAAGTIHFAHGIMTPGIGWGDPDMKDRKSPYYLGGYYPPDGPAVFMKQVPMKPVYRRIYADPRFRLPLYEVVFHDSVVATHQWGFGSLKFVDDAHTRELLELLYNVPPLYHINLAEWDSHKDAIKAHYAFFSPLHREAALLPMTDFRWLNETRSAQRTVFGDRIELVANFGDTPFRYESADIPAQSILAKWRDSGKTVVYSPGRY